MCNRDNAATYKISDTSLANDAIFDEHYATTIDELYAGTTSIPYTKVTLIHYQTLSKKGTTSNIDVKDLPVCSLQGLLLLFLDKCEDLANRNEEIYNPNLMKVLETINDMPHQLFAAGIQARNIYSVLKKYFKKEHSNVT